MTESKKNVTIEDVVNIMKKHNRKSNTKKILKAYEFAYNAHIDQKRESGEPYIIHPVNVAAILASLEIDDDTICAALLHDVIEDTSITREDISKEFGEEVTELIDGVTKLKSLTYTDKEEQQMENYRKMFLAMGKDARVILIKLADRLHNMRTLNYVTEGKQIRKAKETMDIYAPLANRLGIYSLKWELEDLAFRYLYPEEYMKIVEGLSEKRQERLAFLDVITDNIKKHLKAQRISFEIQSRAKHLYSIYRKMQRDHCGLESIYDLFAIRVIVNTVKDCYTVLGIVHELYTPMTGRFKDYIAVPKANMYQSIHTTLLGTKGVPFEVQIRTWDMHRIAEFGIAAHWAYKEANKEKKSNVIVKEDKLAWLRETLEWQKDTQDPEEFMKALKTELFEDEVYVFTPRGDIKVLPKGAIPIDFAYAIHEQIGHKMVGAKINGKMKPIITPLENGDIVEIITSDSTKGPSRDWLKIVKSSTAKTRIQQWFKKADREKNIVKGRELLEKEIKRIGISQEELMKSEWVQTVLQRYKFDTIEDMYSNIGFGAITVGKIISRLLAEYRKVHKEVDIEEKIEALNKMPKTKISSTNNGIIVKGIDNCLVKLAKCCNPLPGDEIVGYITKGRGVSVHRTNCTNINELISEGSRLIDVEWYQNANVSYNVDIEIYATDRSGLLSDIVRELGNCNVKLMGVNSKVIKNEIALTEVKLEVVNLQELNKTLKVLREIESVYEVSRKK